MEEDKISINVEGLSTPCSWVGILRPRTAEIALEFYSRKKMKDGILLYNKDAGTSTLEDPQTWSEHNDGILVFSLSQLTQFKKYPIFEFSHL